MRSRVSLLLFLGLLLSQTIIYAQQDAQWSHYMFNGLFYNPGYSGIEKSTRFTLITRTQWLGYTRNSVDAGGGPPKSTILSINSRLPFLKGRTGAGGYLVYDTKGPLTSLEFQPSFAYHIPLANGLLGIGVRAGIVTQRINTDWYRVVSQDDPSYIALISNRASQLKMDYGTGLWYEQNRWYAGVSINHLSKSKFSFGTDSIKSVLNNHMHITGGYRFQVSSPLVVTPSAIIQTDLKQVTFVVGPMATYNEKYWLSLNARQSIAKKDVSAGGKTWAFDDIIFYGGLNLLKNNQLRAGYAFDLVTSGRRAKAGTSHEIMLSYMLPPPGMAKKPPVRTPRYRHDEN
jgi:type IX secretion system PorP/SprF family membrane protein